MTVDFDSYLRAKRTVDDRAIDRRLHDAFCSRLADRADTAEGPLRILEVGAGIGTMPARLLEWGTLPAGRTRYAAVDVDPDAVAGIEPYLREWAAGRQISVSGTDPIVLADDVRTVEVEPITAEAISYAEQGAGEWDALIGSALLDILKVDGIESLLGALDSGGLYYFPITFDGATRFRPTHPADRTIEQYYHDHMDTKPGGNSRAGGAVLARLQRTDGVRVLGAAGSDWIVRPVGGEYPDDEAAFLRHILDTIEGAVGEIAGDDIDVLEGWLTERRGQLDTGELLYLTHQLDILGLIE